MYGSAISVLGDPEFFWGLSGEPRAVLVSWAEGGVPLPARRIRVSWIAGEIPLPARTIRVSWAEMQVSSPERTIRVSWARMRLPEPAAITGFALLAGRKLTVSIPGQ